MSFWFISFGAACFAFAAIAQSLRLSDMRKIADDVRSDNKTLTLLLRNAENKLMKIKSHMATVLDLDDEN